MDIDYFYSGDIKLYAMDKSELWAFSYAVTHYVFNHIYLYKQFESNLKLGMDATIYIL